MTAIRWKAKTFAFSWYFYVILAIAAVTVTASQVAEAIRNSPNANAWLKANADAVGRLAMFESGGNLSIYNGTCCTGILQMNNANIRKYASMDRQTFAQLGLQEQVDAWSKLTTAAMGASAPQRLSNMTTFDGRTVTGDMVLACIQLGVGNCNKMLNSGSCSGFADSNGTTICKMAEKISGGNASPVTPTPSGNNTPGNAGGTYTPPSFPCIRDADGSCLNATEAMKQGFAAGSGVTMEDLRKALLAMSVAMVVVLGIGMVSGVWNQYANGRLEKVDLIYYAQRGVLIIMSFFVVVSLV